MSGQAIDHHDDSRSLGRPFTIASRPRYGRAAAVPGEASFYFGLLLIVIGTGLLKPNVSAMVGTLYEQGDVRRDSGFSIYYMVINVGAFISPFVVGGLAQLPAFQRFLESVGLSAESSWHFGFAMAALGMLFGLVWYVRGGTALGDGFHSYSGCRRFSTS